MSIMDRQSKPQFCNLLTVCLLRVVRNWVKNGQFLTIEQFMNNNMVLNCFFYCSRGSKFTNIANVK